jgi:hypothetical protein
VDITPNEGEVNTEGKETLEFFAGDVELNQKIDECFQNGEPSTLLALPSMKEKLQQFLKTHPREAKNLKGNIKRYLKEETNKNDIVGLSKIIKDFIEKHLEGEKDVSLPPDDNNTNLSALIEGEQAVDIKKQEVGILLCYYLVLKKWLKKFVKKIISNLLQMNSNKNKNIFKKMEFLICFLQTGLKNKERTMPKLALSINVYNKTRTFLQQIKKYWQTALIL